MSRRRVTLYAAFAGDGTPCINVYGWDRRRVETLIADRIANGEAFHGEHCVQITVAFYNAILARRGLPMVAL